LSRFDCDNAANIILLLLEPWIVLFDELLISFTLVDNVSEVSNAMQRLAKMPSLRHTWVTLYSFVLAAIRDWMIRPFFPLV